MPRTVSGSWSTCGSTKLATCTSPFRKRDAQYSRSRVVPLHRPCVDTAAIVSAAVQGLRAIFQPGFSLAKAGVILVDLQPAAEGQLELSREDDEPERDGARLMQALDVINDRWGKGTMLMGSAQARRAPHGSWETKQERRTLAYTTEWAAMPVACRVAWTSQSMPTGKWWQPEGSHMADNDASTDLAPAGEPVMTPRPLFRGDLGFVGIADKKLRIFSGDKDLPGIRWVAKIL